MSAQSSLWSLCSAVSAAVPERPAIWTWDRQISFSTLHDRASRFAGLLADHGLGAHRERDELQDWECGQDTVGLCLVNGPEFIEANLGAYGARAAPFNVNWRYVAAEIAYLLNDSAAAAVVFHARFAEAVAGALPLLRRIPLLIQVADESGAALIPGAIDYEAALAATVPLLQDRTSADDGFLLYSGGTTGMPKGVIWRQADIWQNVLRDARLPADSDARTVAEHAAAREPETSLISPPLIHGAGQWQALQAVFKGDCMAFVARPDRLEPEDFWRTIERARINISILIGEAFARPLMDEYEAGSYDASSLRTLVAGGAFTSQETKDRIITALPDVRIHDSAGSSESGRLLRKTTSHDERPAAFSLYAHSTVLDTGKTRRLTAGEDQEGWLAGSGHIPLGYLGDEAKTRATFIRVDGIRWAVSGDRVRLLPDGTVDLLGRDSSVINTGGEKVFAEEVEEALLRQPGVVDVVVVGRPSPRWGQEVCAILSCRPGADPSDGDLLRGAARTLARYKLPKAIIRVARVERGPNGKVDLAWARSLAAADGPASGPPPELNIWNIFRGIARVAPERVAIRGGPASRTYGRLLDRASRLANVFARHGLGLRRERSELAGWECGQDTVALYMTNCTEYVEANLGGYAARTAPFNASWRYVADELAYLLDDAQAGALVYQAQFAPVVAEVLPRLKRRPLLLQVADASGIALLPGALDYETALAQAPAEPPALRPSADDGYILYTGGTTGMPKGVLWRHEDVWRAVLGGGRYPEAVSVDEVVKDALTQRPSRHLVAAPLMHAGGNWAAFSALTCGDSISFTAIVDRLEPEDFWETVERDRIEKTVLVGEAYARPLLAALEKRSFDLTSLTLLGIGGAFTSAETKDRLVAALPWTTIFDSAGSSESGRLLRKVTTANHKPQNFKLAESAAILDDTLSRVAEPGHEGMGWLASTGHIPLGYLGDAAKTARTFPVIEGRRWVVPGDRAKLLADGSVELLGRDSTTINTGGEKVFAEEVEQALLRHPAAADVIVVGRPSERWGQEVTAIVAMVGGCGPTDDELRETVGKSLARYKLPKTIIRVDAIQRSPNGKADPAWVKSILAGV